MNHCKLIQLPERKDDRGALTFAQLGTQLPFVVNRIFCLYNLHAGVSRGGHAHRECHQFLIAAAGTFSIITDRNDLQSKWLLNVPNQGLYVPPGYWVELTPGAEGAVLVVLASQIYDEADYIRDRVAFKKFTDAKAHKLT